MTTLCGAVVQAQATIGRRNTGSQGQGAKALVQEGFIELESREDLKEDLKRIKSLVGLLGY